MARHDEAYAYAVIKSAALQDAAEAATRSQRRRAFQLAAFASRSARQIGATA